MTKLVLNLSIKNKDVFALSGAVTEYLKQRRRHETVVQNVYDEQCQRLERG